MGYGVLKFRHNILNMNSLAAFGSIQGGLNQECRDVYFVRALGTNGNLNQEIDKMEEALTGKMLKKQLLYQRIEKLPVLAATEDTNYYLKAYTDWRAGNKSRMETKVTGTNPGLDRVLGNACNLVLQKYANTHRQATESMEKNFIVKLLFWFDCIMDSFFVQWNERCNIKIMGVNVKKEQEYLFFYFLTLAGVDVLLLQTARDVEVCEELKQLSASFVIGEFGECMLLPYDSQALAGKQKEEERKALKQESPLQTSAKTGNIKIVLPERNRRPGKGKQENPVISTPVLRQEAPVVRARQRAEKNFEELAALATSVVMILVHDQNGEVLGSGSGIMIGEDGYILTNDHVARGGYSYSVRIEEDERIYSTNELIKYNTYLDLAILRIDRRLNPLPIYNGTEKLVRGQKVVAIGSPMGLFNSVSDGIISGFRVIQDVDMIQFTAPISSGSSGGALLNMYGEVIGISTARFDGGQNINLAMGYECINTFVKGFTPKQY